MSDPHLPVTETFEQTPEPSLRDTIKSAFEEANKPETPAEGAPAEAQPLIDGRERDEQGRFIPKLTEPKRDTLTLPKKDAIAQPAAPEAVKPPDGWTAAAKAEFNKLTPLIQGEVLRREKEAHQKITAQDSDRSLGVELRKIVEPYLPMIQADGGDIKQGFQQYLNYAYVFRSGTPQQKQAALHAIANAFNVPLGPLQHEAPQNAPAPIAQADVQRLVQAEIQNQRQAWEQATLKGEIEAFSADAGHEHFETVKPIMAALLESGKAETLQDAYDQAIWAEPSIRSTLSAQQLSAAETKRLTDSKQRTDAAKRASPSVTGGPGGAKPSANGAADRSLRDELKANFAAATGRV
jgi:hypothetical protein